MKCNTLILHLLKELLSECMRKIIEDKNSYVSNPAYFTRKKKEASSCYTHEAGTLHDKPIN